MWRIWTTKKDYFRCGDEFNIRNITRILKKAKHSAFHNVILSPSNQEVEISIKFVKPTIKKCIDTNQDIHLALLQIKSTALGAGFSSLAIILFIRPIEGILSQMNGLPINKYNKDSDTHHSCVFHRVYSSNPVGKWGAVDT